jgi:hypothetical protein
MTKHLFDIVKFSGCHRIYYLQPLEADQNAISRQHGNNRAGLRLPALLALNPMNLPLTKKNA